MDEMQLKEICGEKVPHFTNSGIDPEFPLKNLPEPYLRSEFKE